MAKYGRPVGMARRIEYTRDVGMFHRGEHLTLLLKAGDHFLRTLPSLMIFKATRH